MKSIEIITDIRRQAAIVKSAILYLQQMRTISGDQKRVIEIVRLAFNKIIAREIKELRRLYGDEKFLVIENIDLIIQGDEASKRFGFHTKSLIEQIKKELSLLQMKILTLPGDDGCNGLQSNALDNLQESLRSFRNQEFGELLNAFQ
jgi:hypothetical protein